MKMEVYSVFDRQVKAFLPPFYARTRGEAIRMFQSTVNDGQSMFHKYAEDYELVLLGWFDDSSGELGQVQGTSERVISAVQVLADPEGLVPPPRPAEPSAGDAVIARRRM